MNAIEFHDGKCMSTREIAAIGVKSLLAGLTAELDLRKPNPPAYVGVWSDQHGMVEWRPMPVDDAEQESMLDGIIQRAHDPRGVIPRGVDCTPPCATDGEWFYLFPPTAK